MELDSVYQTYRPLLLSIAYRMLGSVTQAEDFVQDAFLTIQQQALQQGSPSVRNPKSYLCKIVTNRCLDYLKSARKKREVYVGPWLPEPLVHDYAAAPGTASSAGADPIQSIELEDSISYAFLVMLEKLTPIERAVFILREAFDYDYREIADFVNRTELGCRKIYSRLKRKIGADEQHTEPAASKHADQLVMHFLHATSTGNMEALFAMLSEDIVLYSDGGGKVFAAIKPVETNKRVLAFIQGLASREGSVRLVRVNGQLGFVLSTPSEPFPTVMSFAFKDGLIHRIYLLRNPDKMAHLQLGQLPRNN